MFGMFTLAETSRERQRRSGMHVPTKGIRPQMDGVVRHALAFNTLLSSQETDTYALEPPGGDSLRYVLILSGDPVCVKFSVLNLPVRPAGIRCAPFPEQLPKLTPKPDSCRTGRSRPQAAKTSN